MKWQPASLWQHLFGWVFLAVLAGLAYSPPVAANPSVCLRDSESVIGRTGESVAASPMPHFAVSPLGAWYDNMYTKFQSWLGSERHMIQFGCIGMVVALFIIWWRKT